jgi:hypothetical protein
MNEKNKGQRDTGLEVLIIAIIGFFFYKKVWPQMVDWYFLNYLKIIFCLELLAGGALAFGAVSIRSWYARRQNSRSAYRKKVGSLPVGIDEKGHVVYLHESFRCSHCQVLGTTRSGKSESVILPWCIHDIVHGNGLIIIDGKSSDSFRNKLYSYVVKNGRKKDFKIFSLGDVETSSQFNPFDGDLSKPELIAERVYASFPILNEYYRAVQFKVFSLLVRLIASFKKTPTFALIHRLLTDLDTLKTWANTCTDLELQRQLLLFCDLPSEERSKSVAGLEANLIPFVQGDLATLVNCEESQIKLDEALEKNQILYFQLPTMYSPVVGATMGRLVLQSLQSAIAKRSLGISKNRTLFAVYLDDFQDYINPEFASILNKAGEARIAVTFSHQALGDLEKVSESFQNIVQTCTNIKVVLRMNDPDSCEYMARTIGTKSAEKSTERSRKTLFGKERTGDESLREVQEFMFHPDKFKSLPIGRGIVTLPNHDSVDTFALKFRMYPELPVINLPRITKKAFNLESGIVAKISAEAKEMGLVILSNQTKDERKSDETGN